MNRIPAGAAALALLGLLPILAPAEEATTTRNANLRRDPSTASPVITVLERGARLTLVDASADSGYYHVRTEDDQVGWVYARLLAISAAPLVPEPAATTGIGAVPATACESALWTHVYHPTRLLV
jgi:uncharacterized protein YraI